MREVFVCGEDTTLMALLSEQGAQKNDQGLKANVEGFQR